MDMSRDHFSNKTTRINRRAFLHQGTLILAATALPSFRRGSLEAAEPAERALRIGLLTDLHHADKPSAGTRHYRDTLAKLDKAAAQIHQDRPDHVVELGDIIDAAESVEVELRYLRRINRDFTRLPGRKHYVLGNHCVDTLSKEEFLEEVNRPRSYYSFDDGGYHFVILDACFRQDGVAYQRKNFKWTDTNVPPAELDWLKDDLSRTDAPTIVFVHQRLDVSTAHGVKNAAAVRSILEASGKVTAVFQGHNHANFYKIIGGIHYITLVAMIEGAGAASNAWSRLDLMKDGSLHLEGFLKQNNYRLPSHARS